MNVILFSIKKHIVETWEIRFHVAEQNSNFPILGMNVLDVFILSLIVMGKLHQLFCNFSEAVLKNHHIMLDLTATENNCGRTHEEFISIIRE